jgi:hypothetical protein
MLVTCQIVLDKFPPDVFEANSSKLGDNLMKGPHLVVMA